MIAYLHRAPRNSFVLTICARPCNGEEFQNGERITVSGVREARAICKSRNLKAWNF